MNMTTLNIRVSPRRILSKSEAADYVGLPIKRFSVECRVSPIRIANCERYDIQDLDRWIDVLKDALPSGDDEIVERLAR
jgi:hypothetical protein